MAPVVQKLKKRGVQMPTITDMQIQKNNKQRANLYLDGQFAFALEMITVMKLGLKIGMEVTQERLEEAVFDSEKSVAFEKAMDYLGKCMRTSKQVRDYLAKKGYTPQVVAHVVQKLVGYGYVNDQTYAQMYTQQNSSTKGQRRIQMELLHKGIGKQIVDEVSISQEVSQTSAQSLAQKYMRGKPTDVKTLQKLQRYLLYRGFDYDTVNSIVRRLQEEQ